MQWTKPTCPRLYPEKWLVLYSKWLRRVRNCWFAERDLQAKASDGSRSSNRDDMRFGSREHFKTRIRTNSREGWNLQRIAVPTDTATLRANSVSGTTQGSAKGAATTTKKMAPHAHILSHTQSHIHTHTENTSGNHIQRSTVARGMPTKNIKMTTHDWPDLACSLTEHATHTSIHDWPTRLTSWTQETWITHICKWAPYIAQKNPESCAK